MSLLEIIILLVIAGIAGSLGQALAGFSRGGCFLSIAVGFIGAFLGTWIARQMNMPTIFVINIGTVDFPVVWAIIGAVVFTIILSLLTPRRKA
jgi:uncharacterized membrane protein YeaQ/YmgE (transglycosylase-associated protein family)